jgi:NADH-quinone oxidoreductase subunit E
MSTANVALRTGEHDAIAGLIAHASTPRAACTDVLRYVQAQRGFVSDLMIAEIAPLLGMSVAELDEVATFYNLIFRRPVGETVLFLCNSVMCWMLGQPKLERHICQRLGIKPGETSADGKITLLPIVCLGHCDHAPAMLLNGALHGELDCTKLDAFLSLERV